MVRPMPLLAQCSAALPSRSIMLSAAPSRSELARSSLVGVARRRLRVGTGWPRSVRRDPEPVGNVSQGQSGPIELSRLGDDLVVPCRLSAVARDAAAVQVAGDGGSVEPDRDCERADARPSLVGLNEVHDGRGGEASLGRV